MQIIRNKKVAVLVTCHNRREVTMKCLASLQSQSDIDTIEVVVCLVDDGCSDGTADAVRQYYPHVRIFNGDGSLYWTGGMRLAMSEAKLFEPDFYVWLNDDTHLYSNSIARLLATFEELAVAGDLPPIVVGSLCDPDTGELTYGGSLRGSHWHPLRFTRIPPRSEPISCDVFNGNLVLFHRDSIEAIGSLHPRLIHVAGDYDYALRAREKGIESWVAPNYFGECGRNALGGTWLDPDATLVDCYRRLLGVKGHPPGPRLAYYRAHGGPLWFLLYPLVYARPLISTLSRKMRRP